MKIEELVGALSYVEMADGKLLNPDGGQCFANETFIEQAKLLAEWVRNHLENKG